MTDDIQADSKPELSPEEARAMIDAINEVEREEAELSDDDQE